MRPGIRHSRPARLSPAVIPSAVESLEARQLLASTLLKTTATQMTTVKPPALTASHPLVNKGKVAAPVASGKGRRTADIALTPAAVAVAPFSPAQIRHFYGVDQIANTGAGQTIAIIDAQNLPTIQTDAATFNSTFGLPAFNVAGGPTLTVVGQTGTSTLPTSTATGDGALEIALDVEWAHALAPQANILLIECNSLSTADLLTAGVATANSSGASVVSMSFGVADTAISTGFVNAYDPLFTAAGKTYVASTGDGGAASTGYPSTSPNVVAVGGTSIATADSSGSYGSEVVWNDGANSSTGGAISTVEPKPSYQSSVTLSSTKRTVADVSFEASPNTGVYVYYGGNYYEAGGTSLSAPCWAGLVAVTNQTRLANGLGNLSGRNSTLPRLYQLPAADFHDITSGNNNSNAALPGYDLPTGRGTPVANTLVGDLAGGTDTGTAFFDKNGNGLFDGTDSGITGVTVYADVNNNGVFDAGTDISTTTTAGGAFTLTDVVGGLTVREVVPFGYVSTTGGIGGKTGVGAVSGLALGNFPTAFTGGTSPVTYTLRLDATGVNEQLVVASTAGTANYQVAKALLTSLSLTGTSGDDTFIVDLTNGSPLLSGTVTINGLGQTTADKLSIVGAAASNSATFGSGVVTLGGINLSYSAIESLAFTGGAGNDVVSVTTNTLPFSYVGGGGADSLSVTGGTFAPSADFNADATKLTLTRIGGTTTFATTQHLAALNLIGNALASFTTTGTLLRTSGLTLDSASGATLDLNASNLIYDYATASPLSTIAALLASGYAASAWTGVGIRSSAAATDATKRHTLAYGEAAVALALTGSATGTFVGETVDATTLLVRYTGNGDANLDGTVNFSDFLRLQNHFNTTTGAVYTDGDFDFNGTVDFSDFLKLQNAYGLVT